MASSPLINKGWRVSIYGFDPVHVWELYLAIKKNKSKRKTISWLHLNQILAFLCGNLSSNCKLRFNLQEEVVLAVQRMQVLLELCMMLFSGALLFAIITYQQIRRHFFWSFLISLFGQMFMFRIMPGLLFHCFGVVFRFVKFRFVISTGRALVPYMLFDLTFWPTYICVHFIFGDKRPFV